LHKRGTSAGGLRRKRIERFSACDGRIDKDIEREINFHPPIPLAEPVLFISR
jgi:hypothetical protein